MKRARRALLAALTLGALALTQLPSDAQAAAPAADELSAAQMTVNGMTRNYLLFVPGSYNRPGSVRGLALAFHGLDNTEFSLVRYLVPAARARGLVVAFPQGLDQSWNAGGCCGGARSFQVDDVDFATQLIRVLGARYHPRSVVAAGYSNGAMLAWLLACQPTPLVNGVVDASGTEGVPAPGCTPTRPVTVTAVHGLEDRVVPFAGGASSWTQLTDNAEPFRPITDVIDEWGRAHDRCAESAVDQRSGWSVTRWTGCAGGSAATLYTIDGMGHEVPDYGGSEPVDFGSLVAATAAAS